MKHQKQTKCGENYIMCCGKILNVSVNSETVLWDLNFNDLKFLVGGMLLFTAQFVKVYLILRRRIT